MQALQSRPKASGVSSHPPPAVLDSKGESQQGEDRRHLGTGPALKRDRLCLQQSQGTSSKGSRAERQGGMAAGPGTWPPRQPRPTGPGSELLAQACYQDGNAARGLWSLVKALFCLQRLPGDTGRLGPPPASVTDRLGLGIDGTEGYFYSSRGWTARMLLLGHSTAKASHPRKGTPETRGHEGLRHSKPTPTTRPQPVPAEALQPGAVQGQLHLIGALPPLQRTGQSPEDVRQATPTLTHAIPGDTFRLVTPSCTRASAACGTGGQVTQKRTGALPSLTNVQPDTA